MRTFTTAISVLSLAFATVSFGAGRSPGDILQVTAISLSDGDTTTTAQEGGVRAEVSLTNASSRIITAYCYAVTATYASGASQVARGCIDDVSVLVRHRLPAAQSTATAEPRSVGPRETKTLSVFLPLSADQRPPVSLQGRISMVALDDKTVIGDASDVVALQHSRNLLKNPK